MGISATNRTDPRRGKHYFLPHPLILMPMGLGPATHDLRSFDPRFVPTPRDHRRLAYFWALPNPTYYEQHAEAMELWSPGNPTFPLGSSDPATPTVGSLTDLLN
jgi:hypothetical protein